MRAGGGARRVFHLAQQRIHFRALQTPSCTDAAMAGKTRNHRIEPLGKDGCLIRRRQFIGCQFVGRSRPKATFVDPPQPPAGRIP